MHIHAWMHACTHEINVWHCSMGIPALVGPWQMRRGRGRGAPDYVWRMRTGNAPLGARPHGSLGERPAGHWTEVGLQFHARSQLEGTCGYRNRPISQWFGWVLSWDPELAALMELRSAITIRDMSHRRTPMALTSKGAAPSARVPSRTCPNGSKMLENYRFTFRQA